MDRHQWQSIEIAWAKACKVDDPDLEAIALELDPQIADEFRRLWRASKDAPTTQLLDAAQEPMAIPEQSPVIGERFGEYEALRLIGEGGHGTVYLGQRCQGAVKHLAAIKVLDTAAAREQDFTSLFAREQEILARLTHPYIPGYIDSGVTARSQPFIIAEFVDGVPITEFTDAAGSDSDQSLILFKKVCAAVDFAHRSLVIHRDIKPGNILITTEGKIPKVLDFGVAKLLSSESDDGSTTTFSCTPDYASPEQLERQPWISTATDIYSLGVVLFRMAVGERPYQLAGMSLPDMLRTVREFRVDADAKRKLRHRWPELESHQVDDLAAIVTSAMSYEPDYRYRSARELTDDIDAMLEHRPLRVVAKTRTYGLRRFLRRHRIAAVIATMIMAALAITLYQRIEIQRQRDFATEQASLALEERSRAIQASHEAREVMHFLTDLFEMAGPDRARGETVTVREVLERGSRQIEAALSENPLTRARLLDVIGVVYGKLGLNAAAAQHLEPALQLRKAHQAQPSAVAESLLHLAQIRHQEQAFAAAEELLREALVLTEQGAEVAIRDQAVLWHKLGSAIRNLDRVEEAQEAYQRSLGLFNEGEDPALARLLISTASLEFSLGNWELAEQHAARALAIDSALAGNELNVASDLAFLARSKRYRGEYTEAQALWERCLDIWERILGPDHARVARALQGIALAHDDQGRHREAIDFHQRALAIIKTAVGPESRAAGMAMNDIAIVHISLEEYETARDYLQQALPIVAASSGEDTVAYAIILTNLGDMLHTMGDSEAAEAAYLKALEIKEAIAPPTAGTIAFTAMSLANFYRDMERFDEAQELYLRALAIREANLDDSHPHMQAVFHSYATMLERAGDVDEAAAWRRRAEDGMGHEE